MKKQILHVDVNNAFLSWTAVDMLKKGSKVDIREMASVIGGDENRRSGIVLAKGPRAKMFGISTGDTLLNKATEINKRVKKELGFTVNVGVAHNKLLAKMASDFSKPDKVHTLFEEEISTKMWPLSISELFMLERKTIPKLYNIRIKTIGQLAQTDKQLMIKKIGKHGLMMWEYANGIDNSEVRYRYEKTKGIGNSTTLPIDINDITKLEEILLALTEQVTYRLRRYNLLANVVNVQLRTKDFEDKSHQRKLSEATSNTKDIYAEAKELLHEMYSKGTQIRLIGMRVDSLVEKDEVQLSLFSHKDSEKQEKIDKVVDDLKQKYGYNSITRAGKLNLEEKIKFKDIYKGDYMQDIKLIANKIKQAGGSLYLVGGAIRDELLKKTTRDEDYCVTGITAEKFQEIFPEAHIRGKAFAVFDIDGKEFAMARTESKNGIGHNEFEIKTNPQITIEQDLARRDITINAIAKDVLTGEIIDPFNGRQDLKNKIIKATTEHFKEDPLRVYRVARFAAQLGFEVEKETIKQMNELKNELNSLSSERVFTELSKVLNTKRPSIFFNVLRKADVLDIHFKEIKDLIGAEQPPKYHPEGDAYNHTMLVLDMATKLTWHLEEKRRLEIRFSALVHDLGKGVTPKEEYPHHYGHENSGAELVGNFGNRIKVPNNWIKCGKTACREHMRGGIFYKMKPSKKVEFIERVDKSLLGLDGLQIVVICDKTSGGRSSNKDDISFQYIGKKCLNEIDGEYIKSKYGLNPGIEFGNKLHEERIKWMKNYFYNVN